MYSRNSGERSGAEQLTAVSGPSPAMTPWGAAWLWMAVTIRCDIPRQEISREIIQRTNHSTTLVPAKGMYSGRETNILICVVNKNQMAALDAIIKEYPRTFAVLSSVNEVVGNFKRIDNRGNREKEFLDKGDGMTV